MCAASLRGDQATSGMAYCWPHINRPGKLVGVQGTAPAVTLVFGSHTWSLTPGAVEFRANVHVTDLEWEGDNRLAGRKEGRKAFWKEGKEEKKRMHRKKGEGKKTKWWRKEQRTGHMESMTGPFL